MNRNLKLAVAIVAIVLIAGGATYYTGILVPKSKIDIVTFQAGWTFVGRDAPFFLAIEKGFYEEEGISPRIYRGYGTADILKNLQAKKFDFGMPGVAGAIQAISEGAKVKIVAILHETSVNGVIVKKDSGIKSPKDMVGKKYGMTFASEATILFPVFLKMNGVDPDSVAMLNLEIAIAIPSLLKGDTHMAGLYSESPGKDLWKNVNHVSYADWGLDIYGNVIAVHEDLAKEKPDLIRRFLKASFRGIAYAMANPEEAVEAMNKHRSEMSKDDIRVQMAYGLKGYLGDPKETATIGLGFATDKKMDLTQKITAPVLKYKEVSLNQIYTNEFLTKILPPANALENINKIIAQYR